MTKTTIPSTAAAIAVMLSSPVWASSSVTRTSSFAYDAASGLPIQQVIEPSTSALRLETDYTYDAFGNKLTMTVSGVDIATRTNSSSYGGGGQFPSSDTNALGQSESVQYDARFGQPSSQTGPNGLTTTWAYDGYGRKVQETRPDGTQRKWTYQFCSGVNGGTASCPAGASYTVQATPYAADGATINGPATLKYFDVLDREVARDTQGFNGQTIRATKSYDSLGRVWQTSRPYFLNYDTPQLTTFAYDILGRAVSRTLPDGSVSQVAYHGLTVTKTNALNQTSTITKSSQGNVVSVTDALGKTMTYIYDPFGNLVRTSDAVGNVTTASYDLRGDKISSFDPDLGPWSYTYNTLGLLISQTDGKNQTVNLSYDKLDRLVDLGEPDMNSIWAYDTAAYGVGKLASTSITGGPGTGFSRNMSYDALGRPIQVATTIDGATYVMGASYDANSLLTKISYPSGFTARYDHTSLGDTSQLLDDATGQSYWTPYSLDAEMRVTQDTLGNGITTIRSFDAPSDRLTGIVAGSGGAVQNFSYTYDRRGNPLSRSDANTNLSETFVYDTLNRLTSSTVNLSPTPLSKTFTYDPIGNLLSKSDVGTYSYPAPGSPQPHAVTGVSGGSISSSFTYDLNGNQTSGLGRSLVYTSYNKPSSITQGTRTISFLGDTDHQRFKQVTPEGTTLYISAFGVLAEVNNPGTTAARWTDYLSVGGSAIGMRVLQTSSETLTTRYFHTDSLGSISAITDENGVVQERLSYDAWGKRRFPNGADDPTDSITSQTTRGFTGQEELSVASLVHLNGRVYDPFLARMTSADPDVSRPMDTQGWNRYSYVNNRPLEFVDPTGYFGEDEFPCACNTPSPEPPPVAPPPYWVVTGDIGNATINPYITPSPTGLPGLSCCASVTLPVIPSVTNPQSILGPLPTPFIPGLAATYVPGGSSIPTAPVAQPIAAANNQVSPRNVIKVNSDWPSNGGPPLEDSPGTVRIPMPPSVAFFIFGLKVQQFLALNSLPTPTDGYKGILDDSHLDAARRELQGEVVAQKWNGTPYDHVTEVRNAQQGVLNRIDSLNQGLTNPDLGQMQRYFMQRELSDASRLLDYSERFVPRR